MSPQDQFEEEEKRRDIAVIKADLFRAYFFFYHRLEPVLPEIEDLYPVSREVFQMGMKELVASQKEKYLYELWFRTSTSTVLRKKIYDQARYESDPESLLVLSERGPHPVLFRCVLEEVRHIRLRRISS